MEHWLSSEKPCAVLGCGSREGVRLEPSLRNPVCAEHRGLGLTAAQLSQCCVNPWARMEHIGPYPGCPEKTVWRSED